MSFPFILLCTGPRCLEDTKEAERWARRLLQETLLASRLAGKRILVVTGDAGGFDRWAREAACDHHSSCRVFGLDGWWTLYDRAEVYGGDATGRWTDATPPKHGDPARKRWPLLRNRAEVAWVAGMSCEKLCLAATASWSRTHGTLQTVGCARDAEIPLIVEPCPWEYGPEGVRAAHG